MEVSLKEVGECNQVGGYKGFEQTSAAYTDLNPKIVSPFKLWPWASQFTRTLGSYQLWLIGWSVIDRGNRRWFMTETNGAAAQCMGCWGWWLHAATELTAEKESQPSALHISSKPKTPTGICVWADSYFLSSFPWSMLTSCLNFIQYFSSFTFGFHCRIKNV